MADTVGLTMEELDGLQIMTRIAERRLTRRRAAAVLGLSERQVRRLYRAFRRDGAQALASRHRGRPSNRRLAPATRDRALTLLCERYADFGPTFAHGPMPKRKGRVSGHWRLVHHRRMADRSVPLPRQPRPLGMRSGPHALLNVSQPF